MLANSLDTKNIYFINRKPWVLHKITEKSGCFPRGFGHHGEAAERWLLENH